MATTPAARSRPLRDEMAALAFVQCSPLCGCLSPEQLTALVAQAQLCDYPAGAVLTSEGEPDDTLFIVYDGGVSVCKQRGEALLELAALERAHIFGEIGVLMQQPRSATVVARLETRVVRIPGAAVREVASAEPKFGRRLAALMAARLKDTASKLGGG